MSGPDLPDAAITADMIAAATDRILATGCGLSREVVASLMALGLEAAAPALYAQGAAAERARWREVAIELEAVVPQSKVDGVVLSWVPFADLLDGDDG